MHSLKYNIANRRELQIPEFAKYNFKNGNKAELKEALQSINWKETLGNEIEVGRLNNKFVNTITETMKRIKVPMYETKKKQQKQDIQIRKIVEKSNKINKQLTKQNLRYQDKANKIREIEALNKEIQTLISNKEERREKEVIDKIETNPRVFYQYAAKNKKSKDKIGPLKSGELYDSDPKRMANILSKQYEAVFSTPKDYHFLAYIKLPSQMCPPLNDIDILDSDIKEAIIDMNSYSTPGSDGITPTFYKEYADQLVNPLKEIWRRSLDSGKTIEGTIVSIITPIYKSGEKSDPSNYRPVALTNHITKIFERIIKKALVKHLESNNLLNNTQHGFRKGRSTVTQLLRYYDSILSMLEKGHQVDAIYLDFSKAYDKVDHNILIKKILSLNIGGKVIVWIENFLKMRNQVVRVEGELSEEVKVTSGVPQGSVLGPLLFLIMMNNIDEDLFKATVGSFADDTRLWKMVTGPKEEEEMQMELEKLYTWAEGNNMSFNSKKFEGMRFGKDQDEPNYVDPNHKKIEQKSHIKDLGVLMSNNLKFDQHIRNVAARGSRMVGWIMRTFKTRKLGPMRTLLKTLIVSQVEYCCILWSPTNQKQIDLIENVQRKYTSKISCFQRYNQELNSVICEINYKERLKTLKIYSLERRRERYHILYVYKIISGIVPNPGLDILYFPRTKVRVEPKHERKAPGWVTSIRNSSFHCIAPKLFNSLPGEMKELPNTTKTVQQNLNAFKNNLDKYLAGIPDVPGRANSILDHRQQR